MFQAGVWPELNKAEYVKFKAALMRVYRLVAFDAYHDRAAMKESGEWMSDGDAVSAAGQMHPATLLRFLRLMTAIRMARKASWEVWCILYAAKCAVRSWIMAVLADVRWLVASSPLFFGC